MKNINPLGLFDDHFLMEKLTKLGDPLQKLNEFIHWKIFESPINEVFKDEYRDLSKGGRPPFSRLMLFKALIIQCLYNLSDDQLEYQIIDRVSFKRFLGLKKSDKVPDSKTKLIEEYTVTDASVHDSQAMEQLLTEKDEGQPLYADSAYTGEDQEMVYKKKKIINKINEKGYRNKPLSEEQKAKNKEKSRTRARVEHLFGFVENSMHGSIVRTIGIARAKAKIGMMNLTYNICRCTQLKIVVAMG